MNFQTELQKENSLRRWCALGGAHLFLSFGLIVHTLTDEIKDEPATILSLVVLCATITHAMTWTYITKLRGCLIVELPVLEVFTLHILATIAVGSLLYRGAWILLYSL